MQEDEQAEARPASAFRTGRTVLEAERRRKGLPAAAAGDEAPKGGRQPGARTAGVASVCDPQHADHRARSCTWRCRFCSMLYGQHLDEQTVFHFMTSSRRQAILVIHKLTRLHTSGLLATSE